MGPLGGRLAHLVLAGGANLPPHVNGGSAECLSFCVCAQDSIHGGPGCSVAGFDGSLCNVFVVSSRWYKGREHYFFRADLKGHLDFQDIFWETPFLDIYPHCPLLGSYLLLTMCTFYSDIYLASLLVFKHYWSQPQQPLPHSLSPLFHQQGIG